MDMDLTEAEYQEVAERACIEGETIHYMKQKITPEIVKTAMQDLENIQRQNKCQTATSSFELFELVVVFRILLKKNLEKSLQIQ